MDISEVRTHHTEALRDAREWEGLISLYESMRGIRYTGVSHSSMHPGWLQVPHTLFRRAVPMRAALDLLQLKLERAIFSNYDVVYLVFSTSSLSPSAGGGGRRWVVFDQTDGGGWGAHFSSPTSPLKFELSHMPGDREVDPALLVPSNFNGSPEQLQSLSAMATPGGVGGGDAAYVFGELDWATPRLDLRSVRI